MKELKELESLRDYLITENNEVAQEMVQLEAKSKVLTNIRWKVEHSIDSLKAEAGKDGGR